MSVEDYDDDGNYDYDTKSLWRTRIQFKGLQTP